MSAEIGIAAPRITMAAAAQERRRDRWFFTGMAVAALLTVFTGFAPTYYLGHFFEAHPVSTLVHVHGALFTSWILLFLTQTSLIAAGGLFVMLSLPLRAAIGHTDAWCTDE